jgi:outer membrane phospholipase A
MSSLIDTVHDQQRTKKIPCEVWTRVVGYFRPMGQANKGKQEEWRQRSKADVAKTIATLCLILAIATPARAAEFAGLSAHEDNYFTAGASELDHMVRFQLSVKYKLFYPYSIPLFSGYTETCIWDIDKDSAPFYDYNHSPELFLRPQWHNIFGGAGVRHKSNGRDGEESRSINYYYMDGQLATHGKIEAGLYGKYYFPFSVSGKNADYFDYIGRTECKLFLRSNYWKTFEAYCKAGFSGSRKERTIYSHVNFSVPWVEAGLSVAVLDCLGFQPKIFMQLTHGYSSTMLDYDKRETAIRGGLSL